MNYTKALQIPIFKIISQAAQELNLECYVIGGFVRDILLNRDQKKDIDIVAVAGKIIVTTELKNGTKQEFILDAPNIGLFIPKMCWRTMRYTHNAVQMCIASNEYEVADYIRNYDDFLMS